ncbi:MAG TPA: site-2 protease family protein [Pyrinomonadaceae bacterium]|nr:site-2 protease family protein [Pyrinomonadaceae bacterium]
MGFFRRQIQVARVSGIPVRIDYRWFAVFALSAWVVAAAFEQGTLLTQFVKLGTGAAWAAGVLTTAALFLSIFGHELSHALAARMEGIGSEEIVLHPFGGLTRLSREPDNPREEFRVAVAGPSASFVLALLFFALMFLAQSGGWRAVAAGCSIAAYWNLFIAVSNLLPGYPLDGGRVLRAFLWKRHGRLDEATRIAGLGGQLIAGALVVFGLWFYFRADDPFRALWLILVGLFLWDAARSVAGGRGRGRLRTAAEAMGAPVAVEPDATIGHFIDHVLPLHRQEAVAVARGRQLHGILTLSDLKQLPRESWHRTRVRDVMRPVSPELFVGPTAPLERAEKLLQTNGAGALAVVNDAGELVGFLLRGRLKRRGRAAA